MVLKKPKQAFRLRANAPRDKRGLRGKRGAINREFREFREIRDALPTFIPKLSTFPKLTKFPNKAPTTLHDLISCQKWSNLVSTRRSPDGTYFAYFPFGLLTERPK